jgi:inositol hexakisphosphate/diphosphoinositol-pentakisphosphate kinase
VKREKFEPSKVCELYDSIKFDLIHNRESLDKIFGGELIIHLYAKSRNLYDFIGPREYGIDVC